MAKQFCGLKVTILMPFASGPQFAMNFLKHSIISSALAKNINLTSAKYKPELDEILILMKYLCK